MAALDFKGESTESIEDAIKKAIDSDPKGDQGTDIFNYEVDKINVVFGGFIPTTTYKVTIKRAE